VALRSLVIRRSIQVLLAVVEAIAVILIFVYASGLNREPMNIWLLTFVFLTLTFFILVFHTLTSIVPTHRDKKYCIFCGAMLVELTKCSKCLMNQPEPPHPASAPSSKKRGALGPDDDVTN